MERSGIEALQEIFLTNIKADAVADFPVAIVPNSMGIQSLERFMDEPYRMRAEVRTKRILEFNAYVDKNSGDQTVVFIHPDGRQALAVIDFGFPASPGWKEHKVKLELDLSPEMQALHNLMNATPITQRRLIEFIEDWHESLVIDGADGHEMTATKAIASVRSVTIEAVRSATKEEADFEASVSALEKVSANSNNGSLPGMIKITCPYIEGLEPRPVVVRLSILTTQDTPLFNARVVGYDQIQQESAKEVESLIRASVTADTYVAELTSTKS